LLKLKLNKQWKQDTFKGVDIEVAGFFSMVVCSWTSLRFLSGTEWCSVPVETLLKALVAGAFKIPERRAY